QVVGRLDRRDVGGVDPAGPGTELDARAQLLQHVRIVRVSRSSGTLRSVWTPGVRSVAAITGSAAFLAPLISTRPWSGLPPRMTRASMMAGSVASGGVSGGRVRVWWRVPGAASRG